MRNAVQRRNHKERAQPLERQKWGLLEKHKDYSLRAKDHNQKKRKLNALKQKAADRNEDEFYFAMMSNKTQGGVKVAKRGEENSGGSGKSLAVDVVKLMKTQDAAYLRTVLQSTRSEREKVEKEVVMGETGVDTAAPASGRTVFDEDGEDIPALPTPPAEEDDLDDLEGSMSEDDEPEVPQPNGKPLSKEERKRAKQRRRALEAKGKQLEALKDREEDLKTALRELEDQRARMSGSAGGVNKNGVKFKKRERSR